MILIILLLSLQAQCYGGEYMSEVFDPLVKRMSYRKQKRWWNAFMLFYTRVDYTEDENESLLKEMALLSIGMFWVVFLNLPIGKTGIFKH